LAICVLFQVRHKQQHQMHKVIEEEYTALKAGPEASPTDASQALSAVRCEGISDDTLRIAAVSNVAGVAALYAGHFSAAIEHFTTARDIHSNIPGQEDQLLTIEANLAAAQVGDLQYQAARESLLELVRKFDDRYADPHLGKARVRYHLAVCAQGSGKFDEAEQWVVESIQQYNPLCTAGDPAAPGMRYQSVQIYRQLLHRRSKSAEEIEQLVKELEPPAEATTP
jgi:hypothetical protein